MIKTTPAYWDCECKDFYIRPARQDKCGACGAIREEQPDSRPEEVIAQLEEELKGLDCIIDQVECFGSRDVIRRQQVLNELGELLKQQEEEDNNEI
jgi:hypothetical protein